MRYAFYFTLVNILGRRLCLSHKRNYPTPVSHSLSNISQKTEIIFCYRPRLCPHKRNLSHSSVTLVALICVYGRRVSSQTKATPCQFELPLVRTGTAAFNGIFRPSDCGARFGVCVSRFPFVRTQTVAKEQAPGYCFRTTTMAVFCKR